MLIGRKNQYFLPKGVFAWIADTILIIITSLAISIGIVLQYQLSPLRAAYTQSDHKAQNLTFNLVSNDSLKSIADYKGKVVFLNFWATWCGPCMEELPALEELQQNYGKKGLVVITISDEKRSHLEKYFGENPWDFVHGYLNPKIWASGPYAKFERIRPVSFIIDRNGIIRKSFVGAHTYNQLNKMVQKYL